MVVERSVYLYDERGMIHAITWHKYSEQMQYQTFSADSPDA